jgi:hypothetical protein
MLLTALPEFRGAAVKRENRENSGQQGTSYVNTNDGAKHLTASPLILYATTSSSTLLPSTT